MFWENVKILLSEKKLLQKDFAELLGINISTLKNQMTRNIIPDAIVSVKIAKALNTSVEYLVTGEDNNSAAKELETLKSKLRELLN